MRLISTLTIGTLTSVAAIAAVLYNPGMDNTPTALRDPMPRMPADFPATFVETHAGKSDRFMVVATAEDDWCTGPEAVRSGRAGP